MASGFFARDESIPPPRAKPKLFLPPESSRFRGLDLLDTERLPKLVYAVLARRTTGVSFPARVDSVEVPYVGC